MGITELSAEEKDELRSAFYYGCDEYDFLSDEEKAIVDNAEWYWDIPDSILISAFGGYSFVPEDFWCNVDRGK